MNSKAITLTFILLALPLLASAQVSTGGPFTIEKSVVASGGGSSSSGPFAVTGTSGQAAAGTTSSGSALVHQSGFWTPDQLAPSAAEVSVSGRVSTAGGAGIRNALVTLTDSAGVARRIATGSLGFFLFGNVEIGQSYTLTVSGKRFRFSMPTRIVMVGDEVTGLDFTANAN